MKPNNMWMHSIMLALVLLLNVGWVQAQNECTLVIDNFNDASQFNAGVNDLGGSMNGGSGMMSSIDPSIGVLSLEPSQDLSYWTTSLRQDDTGCFDASAYSYISFEIAGSPSTDFNLVLQRNAADCGGASALETQSVSLAERIELDGSVQLINIPLSEFGMDLIGLHSLAIASLSGPVQLANLVLKRSCADDGNVVATPRTAAPVPCSSLVEDYSLPDASVTSNRWFQGVSSDDGSMQRMELENGRMVLQSNSMESYFYMTTTQCQDMSSFDYLRITMAAPSGFQMRVELHHTATTCGADISHAEIVQQAIESTDYINTWSGDGQLRELWIPMSTLLNDADGAASQRVTGLLLGAFYNTENRDFRASNTITIASIDFVRTGSDCSELVRPVPDSTPEPRAQCGLLLNDFEDPINALTLNNVGGNIGDDGTMAVMRTTTEGTLLLRSRDMASAWYTHVQGVCLDTSAYDYLHLSIQAPANFDMGIQLLIADDCNADEATADAVYYSRATVQAANYVVFAGEENAPLELYVPLTDFANYRANQRGVITSISLGSFEDTAFDALAGESIPVTIELDNISLEPATCAVVPPVPLPSGDDGEQSSSCKFVIDSFTSVRRFNIQNRLGLQSSDVGTMASVVRLGEGAMQLTSASVSSYWFTYVEPCSSTEGFDFVYMKIRAPAGFQMRVDLNVAEQCDQDPNLRFSVQAQDYLVFTNGDSNDPDNYQHLFLPLDDFGEYRSLFDRLHSITLGEFLDGNNPLDAHETVQQMTIVVDDIALVEAGCPDVPPRPLPPLPCELRLDSFNGERVLNLLGEPHGDDGTMETMTYTEDGRLQLVSASGSSFFFSSLPLCFDYRDFDQGRSVDYLYAEVQAIAGFDMTIQFLAVPGCDQNNPGDEVAFEMNAAPFVSGGAFSGVPQELRVPLTQIPGFNADTYRLKSIIFGTFSDTNQPEDDHEHGQGGLTLMLDNLELRPDECPTYAPSPAPGNDDDDGSDDNDDGDANDDDDGDSTDSEDANEDDTDDNSGGSANNDDPNETINETEDSVSAAASLGDYAKLAALALAPGALLL
jgi:hypothetical protein